MAETTDISVRGVLQIQIPDPPTELSLVFERSEDGDTWDTARLATALGERGVREGYGEDELSAFLVAAANVGSGPYSHELLTGLPPQQPQPDRVVWNEWPEVPPDIAAVHEQVVSRASAPEIFKEVREKVQQQKEVARKGKLPFGQPKTEIVTVTETVVTQERVYVDPAVTGGSYVEEGAELGTLVRREMGIPGRDIFGKTLPVKQLADPGFYEGAQILRRGELLIAKESGFLRIGKNWADIVPFVPHRWSIEISRDRATCCVIVTPGSTMAQDPDPSAIRTAAIDQLYPEDSLIPEKELEQLLRSLIERGEEERIPISLSRDGSFDITISEDKLSAFLSIHKGKGRGTKLTLKEIGAAIKGSGLVGMDLKQIGADITAFYEGPEFDVTGYLLCEGKAPTPGPDRHVEFAPTFDKGEKTAELIQRLDPSDQYESFSVFPPEGIQKTAMVLAEQLVCSIDPPVPGEPGRDVHGAVIPAPEGNVATLVVHENLLLKNNVIAATIAGVLDYGELEGAIHLRVRPHVDAVVNVSVSEDRMEARLALNEGQGSGLRVSRHLVDAALEAAHVVYGINDDRISHAIEAAKAGTEVDGIVIAEGTNPVDQSENMLEFLVDLQVDTNVRIRKDGTADYRNRNSIVTLEAGQAICRILPSQQEPIDGTDVTGKTIPARTGGGAELELGDNVEREELEDGTFVIKARTEGELVYTRNRIDVQTTHTIKGDVDMKVGNVKFPGTVVIGGTVRSGFYVISGGDVQIAGAVEGALISSDGDMLIQQGVKGAGKAVLRSKRNIASPFVELATVLSVGNIILKNSIVRSRVKCNGKITFQGDKGRIIGGMIRARHGVEVMSIGTPRGATTHISFGQDYLIGDLIDKEELEIEKVKRRIGQVDTEMRQLEKQGSKEKELQHHRKEKVQLLKLMEKRGLRLFTLRERFEQHFPSKIVVTEDVHIGTVFESHGRTYEITSVKKGIAVEFNPQTGNIEVKDLKEESSNV